jgi:FAD:protein FMN transferase
MRKQTAKSFAVVFFFVILSITIFAKQNSNQHLDPKEKSEFQMCDTRSIMATAWTICVLDETKSKALLQKVIDDGMGEIVRIDLWMSEWKPKSLISQINENAGIKPVKVSDEALQAIRLALKHSELSKGAFDITFNAFFGLYNWKEGSERFPTDSEIKERLELVNYKNIEVKDVEKTVFLKKKGMKIGLGGMGQGWAVDKVLEIMKSQKIKAGYIDGSGDTYFWGRKPDGKLWTVGIGDPRPASGSRDDKSVIYKLYVTDVAVTTSGDTEKFFMKDGKRFHHIIDPRTGYSVGHTAQVTAICSSATICDIADTSIFLLGPEEGKKYAESLGIEAVIVDPAKKITLTKGLKPIQTQWGPALEMSHH